MSEQPVLSVITVTFKDEQGLHRTLDSVLGQDVAPGLFDIVVVDGASDAALAEAVSARLRPGDALISEPDHGVYDAMNKGWRMSRGRWVQFLNSGDTLARPDALSIMTDALGAQPATRWAVSRARHLAGGVGAPLLIQNVPHTWWRHALGLQPHCHQATWFRRDLLELLDGYALDVDFVADFDLIFRAGLVARPLEMPDVLVDYEGGGMSARRSAEIPRLLHAARARRLQLSGAALLADRLFTASRTWRPWLTRRLRRR